MSSSRALGLIALLLTASCASLDFSQASTKLDAFNPASVALLPFTGRSGLEAATASCDALLGQELVKRGLFTRVADASQVKTTMQGDAALAAAVTDYRSKWAASGKSDASDAAAICKTLNVESLVFGEISNWNAPAPEGDKLNRVGLNLRWAEAGQGEILWKASHTLEKKAGVLDGLFGDSQKKTAASVIDTILDAWPQQK